MNKRIRSIAIALLLTSLILPFTSAEAKPFEQTDVWTSWIQYFSPTGSEGHLSVTFYEPDGNSLAASQDIPLSGYANGGVRIDQTISGSAIVSSDIPLVVLYKQEPAVGNIHSPMFTTAFDASQAGEGKFFIPSVQRTALYDSQIGIQNIEAGAVNITLHFYDFAGFEYVGSTPVKVLASSGYIFKLSEITYPVLPNPFEGSLVITTDPADAHIVASVQELELGGRKAYAYEGSNGSATTLYMVNAACKYKKDSSWFYVQNAGDSPTNITISYYSSAGKLIITQTAANVLPGTTNVFDTCDPAIKRRTRNKSLTAIIDGNGQAISAVEKMTNNNRTTAVTGQKLPEAGSDGLYRLTLPYIEYARSANDWRSVITLVNLGSARSTIKLYYYRSNGVNSKNTQKISIKRYAKANTDPKKAKMITKANKTFTGAIMIESQVPIIALVNLQKKVSGKAVGDGYTGIPFIQ